MIDPREDVRVTITDRRFGNAREHWYPDLVSRMNEEIRERLHAELAPCTPQEFADAYIAADPEILEAL